MDKTQLRALVASMLEELTQAPASAPDVPAPEPRVKASDYKPAQPAAPEPEGAGEVDDITQINLRKQYLVEHPHDAKGFLALKAKTPARLGVGRAGTRYKTVTMLRFRADHAAAQDSVFSDVPKSFWEENQLVFTQTLCKSKDEYLTRPDLGRQFDEAQQAVLRQVCGQGARVLLVIGDGLSSAAIEANAIDCAKAIRQGLKTFSVEPPQSLFVRYCRVGASDFIGDVTGCECVCMLVGERPGLVTSESMSCYITYRPHVGIPESKRTVVSNIHRQGTPAVEAGAHIAHLLCAILEQKASGIDLKRGDGL